MDLAELRCRAASLYPAAVRFTINNPGKQNPSLIELQRACASCFEALGYGCQNDLFSEVIPKVEGELSLEAWSKAELEISGWNVTVHMRPLHLGAGYVHFEILHDGPIRKFTETGYRSHFTPITTFAELSPIEYLSLVISTRPKEQQMELF